MFAAIFWMSTAAFTVLWAATGGEWYGFGAGVLLAVRAALLIAVIGAMLYPEIRLQYRLMHRKPPQSIRLGDYAIDFLFLLALGWIAQGGAHYGMPVLVLYVATIMLWEVMTTILESKR